MQRATAEGAAARQQKIVPGRRMAAAGPAVRAGSRPGFRGARPLVYQLLAFAAAAIPSAMVAVCTLGLLLYYAKPHGAAELAGATLGALVVGTATLYATTALLTFRSAAPMRGPLARRFVLVLLAVLATQSALAIVLSATLDGRVGGGAAAALGLLAALGATLPAGFAALRAWAYRPHAARAAAPPLLAPDARGEMLDTDWELATVAAGEGYAAWLRRHAEPLGAYAVVFTLLLAFSWYSSAYLGMNNGDGTARVSQAFNAVFSRDVHLGTLSLIWPPIPALVDIPLVVVLRPFGHALAAGAVMGALFGAAAVVLLYQVLREAGAGRLLAAALAAAFLTQPHLYQSAAAGLSEAPFAAFLLASLLAWLRWLRTERDSLLALAGIGAAAAVMSRYEAVFWMGAMALATLLILLRRVPWTHLRIDRPAVEPGRIGGALVTHLSPFVFVMALWMWVNVLIKGDPLFFLTGPGSTRTAPDTARVLGSSHALAYAQHSIEGSLSLAWDRVALLSPLLLLATVALAIYALRRGRLEVLGLGLIAWSIVAFPLGTAYSGTLPPWVRYWYWVVPMGMVLAAYGLARVPQPGLRRALAAGVLVLAVVPNVRVALDSYNDSYGEVPQTREQRLANALLTTPDFDDVAGRRAAVVEYQAVADAVARLVPPDALVMLDVVGPGGPIPIFAPRPERYVTTTDRDFEGAFLFEPWATVQYMLAPEPTFDRLNRSVLLEEHDGLWEGTLPWAELVEEVPGETRWRLYRMRPEHAPPSAERPSAATAALD